ncbi:TraX family protein [uncultured Helcococcus sp.]|uniref:TraX family protein n=1 Tax=uncultured Helcococcus sp. TaxID=1072508 RepID=UPI0028897C86|nr:TraX family protein [uncultured Helcococcus sp.]
MSTFAFKMIATILMFVDHLAASLQLSNSNLISYESLSFMRSLGRMALPIFAYFLVISYGKTRDVNKYISRLHLGAIISQVPFSLLFNQNLYAYESISFFKYQYENLIYIILIIVSYYIFIANKKFTKDLFIICLAWLISPLNIFYKGNYIFNPADLNIFYELGISLIVICLLDKLINLNKTYTIEASLAIISILAISYFIDKVGNYGFSVLLLIMLLFASRNNQYIQSGIIALWGYYMYSYNITNVIFVVLAGVSLLFYNGKKGKNLKSFFYFFYPLHMLLLIFLRSKFFINL